MHLLHIFVKPQARKEVLVKRKNIKSRRENQYTLDSAVTEFQSVNILTNACCFATIFKTFMYSYHVKVMPRANRMKNGIMQITNGINKVMTGEAKLYILRNCKTHS